MINVTLAGISFTDLPHIRGEWKDPDILNRTPSGGMPTMKGEEATVVRETGELWDSDARPAYSIRIEGMHVGYIPLIETAKTEWIRAKDGYKKVWKGEYEDMTKEQLREISAELIKSGELPKFHDWAFVGTETMKRKLQGMWNKCCAIEAVRDQLYVDFNYNHIQPSCRVQAVYFDEKEGRNYCEVGDICSVSATFDID